MAGGRDIGISDRQLRRWRGRYQKFGYEGLLDGRRRHSSQRRVPVEQVFCALSRAVLRSECASLPREAEEEHDIHLSYTWVKNAAASRTDSAQPPEEKTPATTGALCHAGNDAAIDGSEHRWFQDERHYQLLVILDDATNQIYYAQLVEAESTVTVMARPL